MCEIKHKCKLFIIIICYLFHIIFYAVHQNFKPNTKNVMVNIEYIYILIGLCCFLLLLFSIFHTSINFKQ